MREVAIVEIDPYLLERVPVTPDDDSPDVTGEEGAWACGWIDMEGRDVSEGRW